MSTGTITVLYCVVLLVYSSCNLFASCTAILLLLLHNSVTMKWFYSSACLLRLRHNGCC